MTSSPNHLLAALAPEVMRRLKPQLQVVRLAARQILQQPNRPVEFVYFLTDGFVSFVINFSDGFQAEAGLVGREGIIGLSVVHGVETASAEAVMQAPGEALRMSASQFRHEPRTFPGLTQNFLRFSDALQAQTMLIAACNGHHNLEQRMARWLLMVQDRYGTGPLPVTQELLATTLCVHRPSVSVVASRLQRAGLLRYAGGQVEITDRAGLERVACECYRSIRNRYRPIFAERSSAMYGS